VRTLSSSGVCIHRTALINNTSFYRYCLIRQDKPIVAISKLINFNVHFTPLRRYMKQLYLLDGSGYI
jgi:hypothetical protein